MNIEKRTPNRINILCKDYEEFLDLCEIFSFIKTRDVFKSSFNANKDGSIELKIKDRTKLSKNTDKNIKKCRDKNKSKT